MLNLYKVTEQHPQTTKNGITIHLITAGENMAGICINNGKELFCEYGVTYPVEIDEQKFTIQFNNSFIEHWGGVVKCYVFVLKRIEKE